MRILRICVLLPVLAACLTHRSEGSDVPPPPPSDSSLSDPVEIDLSHIVIRFAGTGSGDITRSREEALRLASEIAGKARAGESFEELAGKYSESVTALRGGAIGIQPSDRFVPSFAQAALALKNGEISDPVETPMGFEVIRRNPILRIATRQIVIMHNESRPEVKRTKVEALKLIQELLVRARAGEDFAELARKYSDAPRASGGGDMGYYGKASRWYPVVEAAAFALQVGQISDVVESPRGFHILQRYD